MPSFQLSPGVVVDPDRGEAYVMGVDGGIVAVDLAGGAPVWRSEEADKPLTLAGELLVGQVEAPGPANALRVVTLDVGRRGEQVNETLVELPAGVEPMIVASSNRSFTAAARPEPEPDEAEVHWEFVERPLRGVAPGPMEVLPGEAPPGASARATPITGEGEIPSSEATFPEPGGEATVVRGVVRVDLSSGTVTATEVARIPAAAESAAGPAGDSAPATDLEPEASLPGVPQPQFLSADGRHVISSERIADDPAWDKYRWTVFERDSGSRVGEVRMHLRYVPFFVLDTHVIHQTPPYARREGGAMVEEPPQLRAVDMTTGAPVWSQPVRDTVDREPPPP